MAKRVDLPADLRTGTITKSVFQELESDSVLVYDGIVVCRSFVIHTPTTQDELQPT